jgi:hypothetical protein
MAAAMPCAGQSNDAASDDALRKLTEVTEQVRKQVEELRGWEFKRPVKTDFRDKEQLTQFLLEKIDEQYGDAKLARKQAMLRMTGMIAPDCELKKTLVNVLTSQIGGFYSPEDETFFVLIRDSKSHEGAVGRILIAHELTHALDDQYVDLESLMEQALESEDRELAIGAIVEGSATVLMSRYMVTPPYNADLDPSELAETMQAEREQMRLLIEAPRYFSLVLANYICGMHFMLQGDPTAIAKPDAAKRMRENVLAAAKNPPRSSEQILHPEKYWNATERDEPVVVDDKMLEAALTAAGLHLVHKDTLGEMLCALLTGPADDTLDIMASQFAPYWTSEAATGWGGDRLMLCSDRAVDDDSEDLGNLAAIWITAWDTKTDCDEFLDDYAAYRAQSHRHAVRLGPRVAAFFYRLDEKQRAAVLDRLSGASGLMKQANQPWSAKQP